MEDNITKYEMICCIVNNGFSETVMDAARSAGARGGTIVHARGAAVKEAQERFGIFIQPEKDLVIMLVPEEIREAVLHKIYKDAGLGTAGQGIAFALPVRRAVGLSGSAAEVLTPEETAAEKKKDAEEKKINNARRKGGKR